MTTASVSDLHYDPYTVEQDGDPNALYARLRDEAPVYRNEERDFWALTRFDDVEAGFRDSERLSSAHGNILEVIKADPGDAAGHVHQPGPARAHDPPGARRPGLHPRRMREVEDKIRAYCVAALEPFEGADRFDFVHDLGDELPMRAIGMLLGIPESEQPAARDLTDKRLHSDAGDPMAVRKDKYFSGNNFAEYVDWRMDNPSDDLVTGAGLHVTSPTPPATIARSPATSPDLRSGSSPAPASRRPAA